MPHDRFLFIAGGSLGVWRLTLCPNLFPGSPGAPTSCGPPTYAPLFIQPVPGGFVEDGYFERKRCVDVAVVRRLNDAVLFALYAASSDPWQSGIGPTELHAWTVTGSSVTPLARLTFDSTLPGATPAQVGTALAVDPDEDDAVYVALGKGGIWRVDLAGVTLSKSQIPIDFDDQSSPQWGCTALQSGIQDVRDLSIIRVLAGGQLRSYLYAALSYRAILEYELTAPSPTPRFSCTSGYAERISAVSDGGSGVLVAVVNQPVRGQNLETLAPWTVNGRWWDICLAYFRVDEDDPCGWPCSTPAASQIQFFWRDLNSGGALSALGEAIPYSAFWGSLSLRGASTDRFITYACSTGDATRIHEILLNHGTSPPGITVQQVGDYVGKALGVQKSTVSLVNPEVLRFGGEAPGRAEQEGSMVWTDPATMEIFPIPETKSICISPIPALPPCEIGCNSWDNPPYLGNIFSEPQWIDSNDATREHFVKGASTLVRVDLAACASTCSPPAVTSCPGPCPGVLECSGDPCSTSHPSFPVRFAVGDIPGAAVSTSPPFKSEVGWTFVSLKIPTAWPAMGGAMQMKWRQFTNPAAPAVPPVFPAERWTQSTTAYITGVKDPRPPLRDGHPPALYLLRGGSSHIRAVRPAHLFAEAAEACTVLANRGFGESMTLTPSQVRHVLSHVELEWSELGVEQCKPDVTACDGPPTNRDRILFNNRAEVYETRDSSGNPAWVLALAAGFVAVDPSDATCLWRTHVNKPMLVLYDVTQTGSGGFGEMQILRVGVGSDEGNAWAVATKTYDQGVDARTYVFVGDAMGRLLVFAGREQALYPPASAPYLKTQTGPNEVLPPLAVLDMPRDPFDGGAHNVLDLVVDGDYLYCALARGGVGIVNVSDPLQPVLEVVLDTPGLVLGLAIRTVNTPSGPVKQLLVGDSRCGLRIYQ